jgi:hypothetical protein
MKHDDSMLHILGHTLCTVQGTSSKETWVLHSVHRLTQVDACTCSVTRDGIPQAYMASCTANSLSHTESGSSAGPPIVLVT